MAAPTAPSQGSRTTAHTLATMTSEDVVIVGGARTPFCEWLGGKRGDGERGGLLAAVTAEKLGAIAIAGRWRRPGPQPTRWNTS